MPLVIAWGRGTITRQKADSGSDFFMHYSFANLLELVLGASVEI